VAPLGSRLLAFARILPNDLRNATRADVVAFYQNQERAYVVRVTLTGTAAVVFLRHPTWALRCQELLPLG
jgi:hypothetical protein